MSSRFSFLIAAPFLSLTLACVPPPERAAARAANAAGDGDAQSCTNLAIELCQRAGDSSSACTSARQTVSLLSPRTCALGLADIDYAGARLAERGKPCAELTARLCGDLGPKTETCQMVDRELDKADPEQCEAMLEHYAEVLPDLQRMEARNQPLSPELTAALLAGDPPSLGPADAALVLVEFSDFQCPYCSMAAEAVHGIDPKYAQQVRVVFRQFPLGFHEQAHLAAQAALAAHAQGKFWEYHDKLFANQKALGRPELEIYAEELGLDMEAFRAALDQGTYKATVDADMALAEKAMVDGTPTMFINGVRVANGTEAAGINEAIEKALAPG